MWKFIYRKLEQWFSGDREVERLNKLYENAFIAVHTASNWMELHAAHKALLKLERENNYVKDLTYQVKIDRLKLQWLNKYRNWKRFL